MAEKAGYYMVIPASVWADTELSSTEKLLYGHISVLANIDGVCTAGNAYFAEQLGIAKGYASDLINGLARKGHIITEITKTASGAHNKREIRIAESLAEGILKNPDTVSGKICRGYPEKPEHNNTSNNNITPIVPTGDEGRFNTFWKAYPRKVNKPKAKKAWDKLKVTPELFETVMNGLDRWKHSRQWLKDGGDYIPHPASWLNGHMFDDEPGAVSSDSQPTTSDRGEAW